MVFSHYPDNPNRKPALASILLTTKKEAGSSGWAVSTVRSVPTGPGSSLPCPKETQLWRESEGRPFS